MTPKKYPVLERLLCICCLGLEGNATLIGQSSKLSTVLRSFWVAYFKSPLIFIKWPIIVGDIALKTWYFFWVTLYLGKGMDTWNSSGRVWYWWLAIFVSLTHYCGILWSTELVLWHPLKDLQHSWPKLASHPDIGGTQLLGLYNKRITKVHWIIERLTQNPGATTLTLSQCLCWEKSDRQPLITKETLHICYSLWIRL